MSKKKFPPTIFNTTDFFGNLVSLSEQTWNVHIITEHTEMFGCEALVEKTVKDPFEVRLSTAYDTGVAFISAPGVGSHAEGIRVIVAYADTNYEKGASTGKVTTAYPVDIINYGSPQLGKTIFKKGGKK